ncbi:transcriptional regulator [Lactobacillus delbrueckii subsp. bulgaricus]|uniref:Putative transcriptional regulator (LytR family) n=1 Tax=Lactobacillus delbrueckii subsp. bulgaricus (strain ATCC 11842 / DSM 20081 / BCRC 10696 / JCM 1002 / NBRC 13953 / NCIMB 11778 / NCTC 12712 / WDCM 00102 / Lb 14) TaxID=390333 RepID=Q1G8C6_LACDA|nr:LCP family protein [Lactobacillus delbrueckii]KRN38442.1 LytR family transcriptional regulator [Lactobacillus delbrueckii subsp. bulgaricus ATCC 11842 = JCM 1002]MDG9748508.1 LCP family protein [Lactobacillus delbrueckii subsp. bulgaricus ATCC 11842 = JCM 1002]GEB91762.1 transcriptional regulator [Lactobacillus delbrueckii subsp. bulgaricus]CAI98770.1 Putative transcriptional regulator (LytR family) [Lactobacillus delbrueckii subsp. bulgaricus ATCC 11842 = JCM 1002]
MEEQHSRRQQKIFRNVTLVQAGFLKKKSRRPLPTIIGLLVTFAVMIAATWGAHAYFSLHSALVSMNGNNGSTATSARIAAKKPISILVLGVDQGLEGRNDKGNSDTIILVTVNPTTKKATMTSIPRDTLTEILGETSNTSYYMFKVNSAYQFGGSSGSVKTVSAMLNVPINYYVEVNMKALESLVNALGGVDVNVPFSFSYDWCDFKKGKQHLDGRHAIAYARMRYDEPRGDYGRQLRQRQIIQAVVKKGLSVNGLVNYQKLLKVFAKYVKTNLTFGDMTSLAINYRSAASNISSGYIQGHDATISGTSLQIASTEELQKWSNKLRKSLGLSTQTLTNQETRQNSLNETYNGVDFSSNETITNYTIYEANSITPRSSDSW